MRPSVLPEAFTRRRDFFVPQLQQGRVLPHPLRHRAGECSSWAPPDHIEVWRPPGKKFLRIMPRAVNHSNQGPPETTTPPFFAYGKHTRSSLSIAHVTVALFFGCSRCVLDLRRLPLCDLPVPNEMAVGDQLAQTSPFAQLCVRTAQTEAQGRRSQYTQVYLCLVCSGTSLWKWVTCGSVR